MASGTAPVMTVKGEDKASGRQLAVTVTSVSEGTIAHVMYSVK